MSDATPVDAQIKLLPLHLPKAIQVGEDARGRPRTVQWVSGPSRYQRRRWLAIKRLEDCWRIDDEWWTTQGEISRMYWQVTLADGRAITLFKDLLTGQWYWQTGT